MPALLTSTVLHEYPLKLTLYWNWRYCERIPLLPPLFVHWLCSDLNGYSGYCWPGLFKYLLLSGTPRALCIYKPIGPSTIETRHLIYLCLQKFHLCVTSCVYFSGQTISQGALLLLKFIVFYEVASTISLFKIYVRRTVASQWQNGCLSIVRSTDGSSPCGDIHLRR